MMTIGQLATWMQVVNILVPAALATEQTIANWIRQAHPQMTEAEMNIALTLIFDDATRRKAMAIADALGRPAPSNAPHQPPVGAPVPMNAGVQRDAPATTTPPRSELPGDKPLSILK